MKESIILVAIFMLMSSISNSTTISYHCPQIDSFKPDSNGKLEAETNINNVKINWIEFPALNGFELNEKPVISSFKGVNLKCYRGTCKVQCKYNLKEKDKVLWVNQSGYDKIQYRALPHQNDHQWNDNICHNSKISLCSFQLMI